MHGNVAPLRQDDIESSCSVGNVEDQNRPLLFGRCAARRLTWWPEIGVGYYPVEVGTEPYDKEYFERFARQADSEIGRKLMLERSDFVERHFTGTLCDIGIGSGAFIEKHRAKRRIAYGYDVNPLAVAWLEERGWFVDPYLVSFHAITFWDVLEHIQNFPALVANVKKWVFVSIPIFDGPEHVLRSKHYRKDEHCWYFTAAGLVWMMDKLGFECVEQNDMEIKIGREDIGSFAFRRGGA